LLFSSPKPIMAVVHGPVPLEIVVRFANRFRGFLRNLCAIPWNNRNVTEVFVNESATNAGEVASILEQYGKRRHAIWQLDL